MTKRLSCPATRTKWMVCLSLLAITVFLWNILQANGNPPSPPPNGDLGLALPDLVVDGMELIRIPAGQQTIDGQTFPETRYYVVFTIRNKGEAIAPPTRVKIDCQLWLPTDVCPQFPNTSIPQLWPKPNEISGAYKVWNSPAAYLREGSMWGFWVTVDPDNLISESNKENNTRHYVAKPGIFQQMPKEALMKHLMMPMAGTEAGVPVSSAAGDSKKIDTAHIVNPASIPAAAASQPAPADLIIQSLSVSPSKPREGQVFELSAQGFNNGQTPINADHRLYLTCRVIQGGPSCPVPTGPLSLNTVVPAKGMQVLKLRPLTAKPGTYEITLLPQAGRNEGAKLLSFTVEGAPGQPNITPGAGSISPTDQPAGSGPSPGGPAQKNLPASTINRSLKH